jgi:glycerol-3-phosphate dehydrogenase
MKIAELYPFVDGEVRYAVRHEHAQTPVDILARRTRLAFLNAQAALEALPLIIDLMAEELNWNSSRREREWKDSVAFLASMGLPKEQLGVSRKDVVSGKAKDYLDERTKKMFSRHGMFKLIPLGLRSQTESLTCPTDGPADTIASDEALLQKPTNPVLLKSSPVND